jgi:hypothetical protein
MSLPEPKDVREIVDVELDSEFRDYLASSPKGIALRAQPYGDESTPVIKAAAGDFAKWLRDAHPDVNVAFPQTANRLLLRNDEIWMPLVFLATDITLPVYLNIVASYLYDRMRGLLRGENLRVHLSVEYQDDSSGKTKRFNFVGDPETFKATIKKIDVNAFFDDDPPS